MRPAATPSLPWLQSEPAEGKLNGSRADSTFRLTTHRPMHPSQAEELLTRSVTQTNLVKKVGVGVEGGGKGMHIMPPLRVLFAQKIRISIWTHRSIRLHGQQQHQTTIVSTFLPKMWSTIAMMTVGCWPLL
mmetsp:Transcript_22183/g.48509  ORF Transcript_22183/g.48509 Transcript_22183/m.48509 type:complete len:131 (-) Transcript_22183:1011-1403(-)